MLHLHALKVPTREKRKKSTLTFLVFTFYCHAKRMHKSTIFSVLHFVVFLFFFIDIGFDFCFSELFLDHFVFVWIRFIKRISTIYQIILKEKENEQLKELWNFLCLRYLLFPQFFPQQCERESCIDVILLKKYIFIYFGVTKAKFAYP